MRLSRCATRAEHRFVLLVPELAAMLDEADRVPGRLRRLMRREPRVRLEEDSTASQLVTGCAIGAAALTRAVDCPQDCEGIWLRADPVDLAPDLSAVWLDPRARLDPGSLAASELVELFADEGLELEFSNPARGYLRLEQWPDVQFVPPTELSGKSMELVMPSGPDERRWRRLINETQVLLHQHRRREPDTGLPGSLWFWGAGKLPRHRDIEPRVIELSGCDPVLEGLAAWLGLPLADNGIGMAGEPGRLLQWDGDRTTSATENLLHLGQIVRQAWRRLRSRRLQQFELADRQRIWSFSPRDAWMMWP